MDEKAPSWPILDPQNVSKFLEESDWNMNMEVKLEFSKIIAHFNKTGSSAWRISRIQRRPPYAMQ